MLVHTHSWLQTPNLRHFSTYPEEALIPTANLMINYVLKPVTHESFDKKYASKRYMKVLLFILLALHHILTLADTGKCLRAGLGTRALESQYEC